MPPIQSIICYVGGSGGDFIKTLCVQQFDLDNSVKCDITDTGMVLHNRRHFRDVCVDYFKDSSIVPDMLDWSKVDLVENSHHYYDWFPKVAKNLYYIDFPELATANIIDVYVSKRHQGNLMQFVEKHKQTLPDWAQQRITEHNAQQFFSTVWLKQLRAWRSMPNLEAVALADFFDRQRLISLVERLTQQPVRDFVRFDQTFTTWAEKNAELVKLC